METKYLIENDVFQMSEEDTIMTKLILLYSYETIVIFKWNYGKNFFRNILGAQKNRIKFKKVKVKQEIGRKP